ncbi:MAG: hypothetical protein WD096_07720 [Actinomycetota bacterium]
MASFFRDLKAKRESARAESEARSAQLDHAAETDAWREQLDGATARLELAQAVADPDGIDLDEDAPILLKKGEFALAVIAGAGLVEMGRERGSYQGGSHGVSVRAMKGVSYRVGAHKGVFVQGPEILKIVDNGTAVVTNQRVVFQGMGKTREWLFTKLIGIDHASEGGSSIIHVSNRQNASGLAYGEAVANEVRFRLDVALALFSSDLDDLIAELKSDVAAIEAERPVLRELVGETTRPPLPPAPPPMDSVEGL